VRPALTTLAQLRLPFALALYRVVTLVFGWVANIILRHRLKKGKEDPARVRERTGHTGVARPKGGLVWMHGASVGESLLFPPLIETMRRRRPDVSILVTTGTMTSAALLARRLPAGVIHQYVPIDRPDAVGRFLDHWKPNLGVFAESDFWPNLIVEASEREISLMLINARMGEKSRRGWARVGSSARRILQSFDAILCADQATSEALSRLSERPAPMVGNLKLAAPPPPVEPGPLAALESWIGERPVWLGASTHPGEDEILLDAHRRVRLISPNALLIIAPRHPSRGPEIADRAWKLGLSSVRRSLGAKPDRDTAVYVADTLGEMGLFYSVAPITFVAGSLVAGIGGHNPVEPARLGSVVLTGTEVSNFADLFDVLQSAGGARFVADAGSLANAILDLESDADARADMREAADKVISSGTGAFEKTLETIMSHYPPEGHAELTFVERTRGADRARA
jgi:3-deoxy-D-manno-octulosonic-acid transferase